MLHALALAERAATGAAAPWRGAAFGGDEARPARRVVRDAAAAAAAAPPAAAEARRRSDVGGGGGRGAPGGRAEQGSGGATPGGVVVEGGCGAPPGGVEEGRGWVEGGGGGGGCGPSAGTNVFLRLNLFATAGAPSGMAEHADGTWLTLLRQDASGPCKYTMP